MCGNNVVSVVPAWVDEDSYHVNVPLVLKGVEGLVHDGCGVVVPLVAPVVASACSPKNQVGNHAGDSHAAQVNNVAIGVNNGAA